jgi:hypothetical protein
LKTFLPYFDIWFKAPSLIRHGVRTLWEASKKLSTTPKVNTLNDVWSAVPVFASVIFFLTEPQQMSDEFIEACIKQHHDYARHIFSSAVTWFTFFVGVNYLAIGGSPPLKLKQVPMPFQWVQYYLSCRICSPSLRAS